MRPLFSAAVVSGRPHVRQRPRVVLVGVVLALVAGCTSESESSATTVPSASTTTTARSCAKPDLPTIVAYRTVPGVAQNLTSVDIHAPQRGCESPVVMWVHGGGYQVGDKANQVRDKVELFNDHGWIFVSVNYRLTRPGRADSAKYPDHFDDVASAVGWVRANIADYGGDPSRIALLGHSAGADIVANVVVNPAYLEQQGLDPSAIRCAGPLDTQGFDKRADEPAEKPQWSAALGNDPSYVIDTSATLLVAPGRGIPATIGVYRGTALRQQIERAFLDALDAAGIATTRIDARSLTHNEVNTRIGAAGDTVMTPPLVAFLTSCFAG